MATNKFVPRLTKPEANNKYYIRKSSGGYSDAVLGNPTDKDCNVLSNCVGYAVGRFNEIGGWEDCKYLAPVNAENFIEYKGSLEVGKTAKLGACMVWKNSGAGHVAIVEKIINDSEIITSESAWGGEAFYTVTRKKGDGNWGYSGIFLGFIYNPAECCKDVLAADVKVGDVVNFRGNTHYLNTTASKGAACTAGLAKVTAIEKGKPHPYHIVGEYHATKDEKGSNAWGWVDEKDIISLETTPDIIGSIKQLIYAAETDGLRIGWNETPASLASRCLIQQWKDRINRYPNLTMLAQKLLGIEQSGVCDSKMTESIKAYQKKCGLVADGGIGKGTWEYLLGLK